MIENNAAYLQTLGQQAKQASYALAGLTGQQKQALLSAIAGSLTKNSATILAANRKDVVAARDNGLNDAMIDRLLLDESRLQGVISDIDNVINLVIDVPSVNGYFRALNVKMSKVYAGKFHSVCIASDGTCFSFGHNAFGNLGNGEISDWGQSNPIPQQIEIKGNEESFVEGSCGENHNLLLTARNNIICFGDNSNNQCSVINKNKVIKCPFVVNKRQEFGIESNCFIEKIYCLKNESLIFIDPYKIF